MTPLRRTILAILVASLGAGSAVGLAACSEDDITGDADDRVSISLRDFDISPERVEVTAGQVEIDVTNDGDRVHELAIRTPSGVERTGEIQPGESDSITVDLPEGTHRLFDPLRDYQDRGMTARIVAT
ncbi:MAG TPA: cupredoxin domain-containing protein, partial [Solirubrobacteraceae bacterium]|nr:cupredoxin domain-containing protein [Solirubrobacteraceae bacterium]